ncbi:MAG: histidine phosphatase family protein, partial [Haliea sp.]|nr:histidine phosphatase family protein [Haliea sp.]
MATLYLFRHGQASFGADDYDKLSALGCRQAQVLGEYLRDQGIKLDAAYSGGLLRQRETTALALSSQPDEVAHHIDPRFDEVRNDEQIRHLVPVVAKANPAIQTLVDKGLSSSKDYQKVIEAVFTYWTSAA